MTLLRHRTIASVMNTLGALAAATALAGAGGAHAQTPGDATKVDKAKPQEVVAAPPKPEEVKPDLTQEAQTFVSGMFANGNTNSVSGRLGGFYQARILVHQLRVDVAAGVAALARDTDAKPETGFELPLFADGNPSNTQASAKLRYDFFLGDNDSLYAAVLGFHDSAANLQLRLRADLGYRHLFFNVPKHTLTGEVGAVYTVDRGPNDGDTNGDGVIDINNDTVSFEKSGGTIGARLAVAYSNALSDTVTFTENVEVIPNIFPDVAAPYEAGDAAAGIPARISPTGDNKLGFGEATIASSNSTLTVKLFDNLSIGANLMLAYDNGAVARRNAYTNHDIALTGQLTYKLF